MTLAWTIEPCMCDPQGCPADILERFLSGEKWYLPPVVSASVQGTSKRRVADRYWCIADGYLIRIDTGYECDFASVPRLAWAIVGHPMSYRHEVPGLIHDICYGGQLLPRRQADALLHDCIRFTRGKLQWLHANTFWAAVRAGGWWPWMGKTNHELNMQRQFFTYWERQ